MTQLEILKAWLPDIDNEALLVSALDRAKLDILAIRFPFGYEPEQDLEPQYKGLQIEWAIQLINKMGAEGETMHIENGVHRTYESADIPDSLKRRIVPMAKAVTSDAESEA